MFSVAVFFYYCWSCSGVASTVLQIHASMPLKLRVFGENLDLKGLVEICSNGSKNDMNTTCAAALFETHYRLLVNR